MSIKHTIRSKDGDFEAKLTPLTAIKYFCIECFGFERSQVEGCTSPKCPLYPFRLGDACSGKTMTEENKQKAKMRILAWRNSI